ncbi:MAG TPA: hypothetical protein VGL53_24760 [Bryobacteraceae bacterium]|jgi:hypothetical protein
MEEHTNEQHQKDYACWCKEINAEVDKLANMLKGLGPSAEVKDHFRNSRIEFLKGLRRMIDEKIERAQSAGHSHGTTVPVE